MSAAPSATTGYRKATSEQRPVRRLAFDRLPAAVKKALSRSLADGGAPRPLLSEVRGARPPSARRWMFVAGGAAAADLVAWIVGFGDRLDDPPLSPLTLALIHAVAVAIGVFAVVYSNRLKKRHLGVPYPAGKHLYELDLVEVDGPSVVVTPLDTLRHIEARPGERNPSVALVFTDGHEVVFANQPDADAQARSAQRAIEAARQLVFPQDLAHLEKVDPFLELRIGADWHLAEAESPGAGQADKPSPGAGAGVSVQAIAGACAVAGAVVLGGMFLIGRSHLADLDDARFRDAQQKPEEQRGAALEEYIARGGRHAEEADTELFELWKEADDHLREYIARGGPRGKIAEERLFDLQRRRGEIDALAEHVKLGDRFAEQADDALFEMAKERRTSQAFGLYLKKGKRHAAEVETTWLPGALFDEALKSGLPGPLVSYLEQYPNSLRAVDAKAAIHKIYTRALDDYVLRNKPPQRVRDFMEAMLASMEARSDSTVIVRVTLTDMSPIAAADADESSQSKDYQPAAPYLANVATLVERELQGWLSESFPRGLVAAMPPDPDDPNPKQPVFDVALTPVYDGSLVSRREQVRFSSVKLRIDFHATLPGSGKRIAWGATTAGLQSFDFSVKAAGANGQATDRADFARKVYGRMRDDMLQYFIERLEQRL